MDLKFYAKTKRPTVWDRGSLELCAYSASYAPQPPYATPGPVLMHMGMHMAIAIESCEMWSDDI